MIHALRSITVFTVCVGALVSFRASLGAALPGASIAPTAPATPYAGAPGVVLQSAREVRELQILKPKDDDFQMPRAEPGLTLTFSVELKGDAKLLDVRQPKKVVAADSSGRDLSHVKPNFMNEVEWVTVKQTWGEPVDEIEFHLGVSSRKASTFMLDATFDALTYRTTEEITTKPRDTFTTIGHQIDGEDITVRLVSSGDKPQLEVRPGAARAAIESVTANKGDLSIESNSSMWDDKEATYYLDMSWSDEVSVVIVLRTGLETTPIRLNLKEHPLP